MDDVQRCVLTLPDGTMRIHEEVKHILSSYRNEPAQVARFLAGRIFTLDERINGNCAGNSGLQPMDTERLELLRQVVFEICNVRSHQAEDVWRDVKKAVDAANRKLRFRYKSE